MLELAEEIESNGCRCMYGMLHVKADLQTYVERVALDQHAQSNLRATLSAMLKHMF